MILEKKPDISDSPAGIQALEILIDKLSNNEYPPGTPLRETVLAVEFKLSRNAVREALNQLVGWDVVEYLPFRGYRVRELSLRDLLEWYELREAIEPIAARRLALMRSARVVDELEKYNEDERIAFEKGDLKAATIADQKFHIAIVANCGNRSFIRQQNRGYLALMFFVGPDYLQKYPIARYKNYTLDESNRETHRVHSEIIRHIRNGNAEEAEALLKLHCQIQVQQLMNYLAVHNDGTFISERVR